MNTHPESPIEDKLMARCEAGLEPYARDLNAQERRNLAQVYYRWAKQLWITAGIMEAEAQ
jgi:hypothetical protein